MKHPHHYFALGLVALALIGCDKTPDATTPPKTAVPHLDGATTEPTTQGAAAPPTNTKCPVSGEAVDPKDTTLDRVVYQGKTYVFCCPSCNSEFRKDPQKAIASLASGAAPAAPMNMGKK